MGLSEEGMQPFELGGNYVVCNGELYGFRTVKQELITKPVKESIGQSENRNLLAFRDILTRAVLILARMLKELEYADRETWASAWGDALMKLMNYCAKKVAGMTLVQDKNSYRAR